MEKLLLMEKSGTVYQNIKKSEKSDGEGAVKYSRVVKDANNMMLAFRDEISTDDNLELKFKNLNDFMITQSNRFELKNKILIYRAINLLIEFFDKNSKKIPEKYAFF